MDYIDVTDHDYLQECLDEKFDFIEWAVYHWKSNVLLEKRGYHARNEKTGIKNVSFIVEDDYVELSNSVVEEDPDVELLPDFGGKAKTLSLSCKFKIPSIKITGKITILHPSKPEFKSDYTLQAKNIEVSSVVAFNIVGDGYAEDYFKHKLNKPTISLTYLEGNQSISLLDKIENKSAKSIVENYIIDNHLEDVYVAMQNILLHPMYDKALCSNTVGADYSLRNKYRIHGKKLYAAFNIFADKLVDISNKLIEKDLPTIFIQKIFKVSKFNDVRTIQILKGVLSHMNCLVRKKTPIILVDSDKVLLYMPVDFNNLKIKYNEGEVEKEDIFETIDTHFEISLKKLNEKEAEINFLSCKVRELKLLKSEQNKKKSEVNFFTFDMEESKSLSNPEPNFTFDIKLLVSLQEKLEEYLRLALKNPELNDFAINPPNVEIEYDSDDFMGEDSEEDEEDST